MKKLETYTVHLGRRLGFYDTLAVAGAMTPAELAARTGAHERYVRHWLEQQTELGLLEVEAAQADAHRFRIPARLARLLAGRGGAAPFRRHLW